MIDVYDPSISLGFNTVDEILDTDLATSNRRPPQVVSGFAEAVTNGGKKGSEDPIVPPEKPVAAAQKSPDNGGAPALSEDRLI